MTELRERCNGEMGIARERERIKGEEDTEPGFYGCEGGPETFEALNQRGGVGEWRWWGGGEAVGVDREVCGVNVELEDF